MYHQPSTLRANTKLQRIQNPWNWINLFNFWKLFYWKIFIPWWTAKNILYMCCNCSFANIWQWEKPDIVSSGPAGRTSMCYRDEPGSIIHLDIFLNLLDVHFFSNWHIIEGVKNFLQIKFQEIIWMYPMSHISLINNDSFKVYKICIDITLIINACNVNFAYFLNIYFTFIVYTSEFISKWYFKIFFK